MEKTLLCKGLKFWIPPKRLDYADHVLPFELLFREIIKNEMPSEDKEFIKTRLKASAFTSFRLHNYVIENNLTKKERWHYIISAIIRNSSSKILKSATTPSR